MVVAIAAPSASAAPFACTTGTIFLAQGAPTQLNAQVYGAGTTRFEPIGSATAQYNGIAFNPEDGFIYGSGYPAGTPTVPPAHLLRIHSDGSVEDLGTPAGFIGGNAGTFDDAGNYYSTTSAGGDVTLQRTDVSTGVTTNIVLSESAQVSDMTYAAGYLWGVRNEFGSPPGSGNLVRIDPTTGAVATFPQTTVPGPYVYGANWTYGNGNLGFSNNTTGAVYQVALNDPSGTPTLTLVSQATGPASSANDGASCPGLPTDLRVEKTGPANVDPGARVTWTITVTNGGPGGSSGFTLNDTIPAGVTNAQTSTPGCTITGASMQCVLGLLPANQSTQIQVSATMPSTAGTCVTNVASVLANDSDPNQANNSDDAQTCVRVADVEIVKSTSAPVVPGQEATYTLRMINHGPDTAINPRASDPLPSGLSFVSASSGCSEAGGTVTCTTPSLTSGATQEFTVTARADAGADCADLANTVTVTSDTFDPDTSNNSSTVRNCERRADRSITKNPSATRVGAGGQVIYTLVVKNSGPSDDSNVTVTDPMAAGLSLVSADPSQGTCSTEGGRVSCNLGDLKAGGSAQLLVTATRTAPAGASCAAATITNRATVTGDAFDPNPDNDRDDAQVCPTPDPPPQPFDLVVSKTVNNRSVLVGQRVTYRVVVRNNGPAAAPDVTLTDTINAPVTVVSVRASQGSCQRRIPMRCELGTIAAGETVTIRIVAKHREASSSCRRDRQRQAASATGNGTDANPANNMDTVDVCVREIPRLKITKVASREVVQGGQTFSYRIRVRNPSKGEATPVRVCDRLPSGLSYRGSTPRARRQGSRRHCWTIQRLGAGQSRTFRVTVRAARGANGRKTNTATVSSPDVRRRANARDRVMIRGAATPVTG